jgi:hypothetical protein
MADTDLSAQFEKISDDAKIATDKLKAASQKTRDQLETDAVHARDKASAAADQFKDTVDAAGAGASSQWREIRANWRAHVASVRTSARKKKDHLDADEAAMNANMAEAYARCAIDFVQAAMKEAEYAALDAVSARANADALTP